MLRYFLAAFSIVCSTSVVQATPVRWEIADGGNNHFYELVSTPPLTWHQALADASARTISAEYKPGHLVTFGDFAENLFVASTFNVPYGGSTDGAWIGFTDELVEGEWHWIDATPGIWQDPAGFPTPIQSAYVNWYAGEPNGFLGDDEDFGSMRSGQFNDYSNLNTLYLAEFEPVPEPSTLSMIAAYLTCLAAWRWRKTIRNS